MNRKPCKTSNGCRARARGRVRSDGQTYRAVTIPQAMKLKTRLIPYTARGGIMNSLPELLLVVTRVGSSHSREEESVSALLLPQRCGAHTPRALHPSEDSLFILHVSKLHIKYKAKKN